uniref:Sulfatase N-terminal domain-containing protein n=1 Tax=Neogobius melanostomus TaxID=47308 RepID=A0A8C6SJE2_9GOBI
MQQQQQQQPAAAAVVLSALSLLLCADASKTRNWTRSEVEPEPRRPHLIFILVDDQGVRLESYYVQPICTPSRSQLLTGRYQIHSGLQHSIIRPQQPNCLPPHLDTLPQRLQGLGYSTHLVGKWHLGFYRKSCLPTRKGFDSFFGSLTGSVDYYSYGSCDGPGVCGYDLHGNDSVAWGHEGRYSTALFTQKARHVLQTHDPRRPLFLLLSLQAVHTPLLSPRSYLLPYRGVSSVERRKFLAMVSTVDEAVKNVTYALRRHGFYKNSVLIYSTDNGAQPFTGGSNWPLRGRKGTYWEGGIRGVGFVHSPLIKRRRRVSTDLLHITDWFPTLVGLAGGDPHQSAGLDGFDVWPTISEGKPSPRTEILHNIDPLHRPYHPSEGQSSALWDTSVQAAIRVGDWKLLTGDPGHGDWVPPQVVPSLPGRWWNLERSFFPISRRADPFERRDLSDHRPEVVQELLWRLVHHNRTAVPVLYPPDDPRWAQTRQHMKGAWEPWVEEEDEEEEEVQRRTSAAAEKKDRSDKKKKEKRKKGKCHLCKLQAFFHKLNSRMMENKI